MNTVDVSGLLQQMRAMSAQAQGPLRVATTAPPVAGASEFGNVLRQSLEGVSKTQMQAQNLAASFERGDPGTDIGTVMVALQKADLSFRAVNEVRNKFVDAYRDVMNMQV
ncbi:MAG TPA: flagellar hook-basal body complex protein FliE [Dokdonella sp.]|jgi:flagellar hook-basal body complex protein FliE|nr:flagellar hook-basal body complex protein FliE [Dokdonella sp.]